MLPVREATAVANGDFTKAGAGRPVAAGEAQALLSNGASVFKGFDPLYAVETPGC